VRNLFDQYKAPENRLTHALACALDADRALLGRFVEWACRKRIDLRGVELRQQSFPGQRQELREVDAQEAERCGIPDACISTPDGWALLIESKFAAADSADQLQRHLRTARKYGLTSPSLLLLTAREPRDEHVPGVERRRWRDLYRWLKEPKNRDSEWGSRLSSYLEIAEARYAADGYLKEGDLTMFSGIPFADPDQDYTYLQAKRALSLLREALRSDPVLHRELGVDPECSGRGAITGASSDRVWDFISFLDRRGKQFTQDLHLTLGMWDVRLEAYVTVPNSLHAAGRRKLYQQGFESFRTLICDITRRLGRVIKTYPGAVPLMVVVQRRYKTQRSEPDIDCMLRFDPRTAFAELAATEGRSVKHQPQWLEAAYSALSDRQGNLQLQVGVDFPYRTCDATRSEKIVRAARDAWIACRPLVERVLA
jgi:hypothetical protein